MNGSGMLHALTYIYMTSSCFQYASLRVGLLQALGMSQEQTSDDQALVKATEQLFTALQKQEQRSHDLEASLHQLEKGFMLGLQDTLSQLGKLER